MMGQTAGIMILLLYIWHYVCTPYLPLQFEMYHRPLIVICPILQLKIKFDGGRT